MLERKDEMGQVRQKLDGDGMVWCSSLYGWDMGKVRRGTKVCAGF